MKLKDIIEKISNRSEVEKTMDACIKSIGCEQVNWKEFFVYDSSADLVEEILENLSIEFLLPIVEKSKKEPEREVIIFCSKVDEKDDEIWFVHVNSTELHATINLSAKTVRYISKKEEKK